MEVTGEVEVNKWKYNRYKVWLWKVKIEAKGKSEYKSKGNME